MRFNKVLSAMAESGGTGKLPPKGSPDLLKPLIFANNQRAFKIFNYVVAAGEELSCD